MYLYKVGTQSSVLVNEVSLFQRFPLRGLPLLCNEVGSNIVEYTLTASYVFIQQIMTTLYSMHHNIAGVVILICTCYTPRFSVNNYKQYKIIII